jgi:homoserine O-acetyltransferase/O-succinyltransferase
MYDLDLIISVLPILGMAANLTFGANRRLNDIENKVFLIGNFQLENGTVMPEVKIAYETYGKLNGNGRNCVLATHGYSSDHHAAGLRATGDKMPGWWDALIGPGKSIDTDRLFVVSSNMLGSSFGSTGPASINPATAKPYGPDFPEISLVDIVTAQRALLDHLGVKHLVAVAGPSFGGYQAFQWGVTFPDFMEGWGAAVSAPRGSGDEKAVSDLIAQLATDPHWNNGWYYNRGGIFKVLTAMRMETLKRYGVAEQLARSIPGSKTREKAIRRLAEPWARAFDGNSLVVLRRAAVRFNAEKDFKKIRAKVLYALSRTDKLFPPSIASPVMEKLKAAKIDATYCEIDSELGHFASGQDATKWSASLKEFMNRLISP